LAKYARIIFKIVAHNLLNFGAYSTMPTWLAL